MTPFLQPGWQRRALLWLLLAESARANRQRYPALPTAWLPHTLGNSLALWLPELLAVLDEQLALEAHCDRMPITAALYRTGREVCVDNPHWASYIAPVVLGYVLSHPKIDIYQGRWAEWRVLGFGLDALPHSMAAFALTLLMRDTLEALGRSDSADGALAFLARNPAAASAAGLALLSAMWEVGEYLIQQEELRRTGGDRAAINMQWTVADMSHDLLSNMLGWLLATLLRR